MDDKLTPADPRDVETALALALTSGKALARSQSAETMSKVVAERLVAHLNASGFIVMRRPIEGGHSQLKAPASWPHTKPGLMATYEARRFAVTGCRRSPAPYPRHDPHRHHAARTDAGGVVGVNHRACDNVIVGKFLGW